MRQVARRETERVLVFGTFDKLHPGHVWFLKQAKTRGKKLYVIVARDKNVHRLKSHHPLQTERKRLRSVRAVPVVTYAQLGASDLKHRYKAIVKIHPDLICLGYDQYYLTGTLRRDLKKLGLSTQVIRLKSFYPKRYKSSLLNRRLAKKKSSW